MVKILDSGVQAKERLRLFVLLESKLLLLLTSYGTMRLFNQIVAPRRGDRLLVVQVDRTGDLQDRRPVTSHLIGVNNIWNIVFTPETRRGAEAVHQISTGTAVTPRPSDWQTGLSG